MGDKERDKIKKPLTVGSVIGAAAQVGFAGKSVGEGVWHNREFGRKGMAVGGVAGLAIGMAGVSVNEHFKDDDGKSTATGLALEGAVDGLGGSAMSTALELHAFKNPSHLTALESINSTTSATANINFMESMLMPKTYKKIRNQANLISSFMEKDKTGILNNGAKLFGLDTKTYINKAINNMGELEKSYTKVAKGVDNFIGHATIDSTMRLSGINSQETLDKVHDFIHNSAVSKKPFNETLSGLKGFLNKDQNILFDKVNNIVNEMKAPAKRNKHLIKSYISSMALHASGSKVVPENIFTDALKEAMITDTGNGPEETLNKISESIKTNFKKIIPNMDPSNIANMDIEQTIKKGTKDLLIGSVKSGAQGTVAYTKKLINAAEGTGDNLWFKPGEQKFNIKRNIKDKNNPGKYIEELHQVHLPAHFTQADRMATYVDTYSEVFDKGFNMKKTLLEEAGKGLIGISNEQANNMGNKIKGITDTLEQFRNHDLSAAQHILEPLSQGLNAMKLISNNKPLHAFSNGLNDVMNGIGLKEGENLTTGHVIDYLKDKGESALDDLMSGGMKSNHIHNSKQLANYLRRIEPGAYGTFKELERAGVYDKEASWQRKVSGMFYEVEHGSPIWSRVLDKQLKNGTTSMTKLIHVGDDAGKTIRKVSATAEALEDTIKTSLKEGEKVLKVTNELSHDGAAGRALAIVTDTAIAGGAIGAVAGLGAYTLTVPGKLISNHKRKDTNSVNSNQPVNRIGH